MVAVQNNQIVEVEPIKETKKGTSVLCSILSNINGIKKRKIISYSNLFDTYDKASEALEEKLKMQINKEMKYLETEKAIDEVMEKIYQEFNVTFKFLGRPSTIDDADQLYNRIKNDENIRNIQIL